LLLCSTVLSAQIPNLIAHYSMDGAADDLSGLGHHGNMVDVTPTADRHGVPGGALLFNGTTSHILVPHAPTLHATTHQLTLSAWVRIDEYTGDPIEAMILEKNEGEPGSWSMKYLDKDPNPLVQELRFSGHMRHGNTNLLTGYHTTTQPLIGQWYHVVIVFNMNDGIRHYLDCVQESYLGTSGGTASFWPNSADMNIGRSWLGDKHFNGAIDDVRIYDRALTPAEVCQLYSIPTSVEISETEGLTVYPNPTDGIFTIEGDIHGRKLSLMDAAGNRMPLEVDGAGKADISALPAGIYFLNITLADGSTTRQRMVKQ
jgi:hypothetical protein